MTPTYNFAADPALPPAIAARMQAIADKRAAAGLISDDGKLHLNAECRDIYDAGHATNSVVYRDAMARGQCK